MDNLNVRISNGKRVDGIDAMLMGKINECRLNVAEKAVKLAKDYTNSDTDEKKDLIACRVSVIKHDIPETMDFVRAFNQKLAEHVDQVDIENRIAEVECSKNINESADIGLNNASDSEDEDEFTEKMLDRFYQNKRRNAAAKKIGDKSPKIDWANIKFDEEAAKFVELDPETVRQAINSDKINGLNLIFLRYVLCKIYIKQIQEHSFEYSLAKEMKEKILMERRLLPTLAKFSAKAREICSKECDKRTDKEKEIVDKAWELYKKVEKLISNIDIINRHLGIVKNGELVIGDDCLNFRREIHCLSARYSPDPLGAMRPWAEFPGLGQIDSKANDIVDKIDEKIKSLLNNADLKKSVCNLCEQCKEITGNIEKINKGLDSI